MTWILRIDDPKDVYIYTLIYLSRDVLGPYIYWGNLATCSGLRCPFRGPPSHQACVGLQFLGALCPPGRLCCELCWPFLLRVTYCAGKRLASNHPHTCGEQDWTLCQILTGPTSKLQPHYVKGGRTCDLCLTKTTTLFFVVVFFFF